MDAGTRERIEGLLAEHDVVLFMKGSKIFPQCGFSAQVVDVLKELGANFHTVNVLTDQEIRQGIKDYSEWPTIPQLYIKRKFIGGSDIVSELHQKGELKSLLGLES